jgi:hypothetical protein
MHVLDFSPINLLDYAQLESHWSTGYCLAQILLALPQAPYLVILSIPQLVEDSYTCCVIAFVSGDSFVQRNASRSTGSCSIWKGTLEPDS